MEGNGRIYLIINTMHEYFVSTFTTQSTEHLVLRLLRLRIRVGRVGLLILVRLVVPSGVRFPLRFPAERETCSRSCQCHCCRCRCRHCFSAIIGFHCLNKLNQETLLVGRWPWMTAVQKHQSTFTQQRGPRVELVDLLARINNCASNINEYCIRTYEQHHEYEQAVAHCRRPGPVANPVERHLQYRALMVVVVVVRCVVSGSVALTPNVQNIHIIRWDHKYTQLIYMTRCILL